LSSYASAFHCHCCFFLHLLFLYAIFASERCHAAAAFHSENAFFRHAMMSFRADAFLMAFLIAIRRWLLAALADTLDFLRH